MKQIYRVVITQTAKQSLHDIISYIKKDSPVAAAKVRKELIQLVKSLSELPERFSKEEYLVDKPGKYHSVSRWHYKIVYKILENEVVILMFIHNSRDTEMIKKIE